MEEQIQAFLEGPGQPQSLEAIRDNVDAEADRTELRETLDGMVKAKTIKRMEDGVDYRGEPMVWYAPKDFKPE